MKIHKTLSPQRHITSDLAGAFTSLSRMASSFIRNTEEKHRGNHFFVDEIRGSGTSRFCLSPCLCVSVVKGSVGRFL